ncbi:1-aminocyclopropane-1-carboxylate deaminase/D-cysteine desulfhydrase [Teredinibacter haidensis]|uniref:1-aminocyclopropane-1-carboxylate deaminase/D-cysteine desulfhydrase n=1 Tax=Teredinibacter haidensis TaxID=2731755 RepID=UPI000A73AEFC|nr:pyridoxal-phosphate dependent enzyme [Teredinibacter haidensis]
MPKVSRLSAAKNLDQFLTITPEAIANTAPLQELETFATLAGGPQLSLLRLDMIDPVLSGNKLFKLYYHLEAYAEVGEGKSIASFGGAYSNHLHALAALGRQLGIPTIGVIRGEPSSVVNATLHDLTAMGMRLHFVSRADYKRRYEQEWMDQLGTILGPVFWVPEGGGGELGTKGCIAIGDTLKNRVGDAHTIALACGTGSTITGVIQGIKGSSVSKVLGYSALKGAQSWLENHVNEGLERFLGVSSPRKIEWQINSEYHCGGFGQYPASLAAFVQYFEAQTQVLLDPVYTAKMLYGITSMVNQGAWPEGARIIAIHTGGLQGKRGINS